LLSRGEPRNPSRQGSQRGRGSALWRRNLKVMALDGH